MGVLREAHPATADPICLEFDGPVAFAWSGTMTPEQQRLARLDRQFVLTGALVDGSSLVAASDGRLDAWRDRTDGRHRFRFRSGASVEGRLDRTLRIPDGRLLHLELSNARLSVPGRAPVELPRYYLLAGGEPVTAQAGAVDFRYHPETPCTGIVAPKPRALSERQQKLVALHERAARAHRMGRSGMLAVFEAVHQDLGRDYPDEWLLRWNLLESLLDCGGGGRLADTLRRELEELAPSSDTRRRGSMLPPETIATGLRACTLSRAAKATAPAPSAITFSSKASR
jgi:hypothetical protein